MKRRLIAAALILVFPFGLAACGAQSKEAACKHIQKAAVSANKSAKIKGTSPDDIRDSLDQIIKTYKKANKKITNKKVKTLRSFATLRSRPALRRVALTS